MVFLKWTISYALEGMLSYFHRSSGFMWTGENDSNTLRVHAYFLGGGKNFSFQKYPDTCGQGLYILNSVNLHEDLLLITV